MRTPLEQTGWFQARHTHLPRGTGVFGMWLFLIALGILFAASMAAYLIIRLTTLEAYVDPVSGEVLREAGPALGTIAMPPGLWVSTAVMLASSFTVHLALRAIRHEKQEAFRWALYVTGALAVMFLAIQGPSLWALLQEHNTFREQARRGSSVALLPYGMVFFLIVVHAAHLLGGMVPLGVVMRNAANHRYDHESYGPVRYLAMYWHFLDVVWLCLFAGFLLIG